MHKTANVLNKLPNSLHVKAKRALQQIWMAETKKDALTAFDAFVDTNTPPRNRGKSKVREDGRLPDQGS